MKKSESLAVARQSLLLRSLPEPVVEDLLATSVCRACARGETVFLQGQDAQTIYVVISGWVKLYRVAPNGSEAVVQVFTRGHSFGEAVALRGHSYPVSAEAVTDCTLLAIPARSLLSMLRREPELSAAIIAATFQHLHELVTQVEQMKSQTGAQRVADFLCRLCSCDSGSCVVTLPYDKVLIAGRLGMKPESLSRAFAKLKQVGVHVSRHHARIDDIAALQDYAESDPAEAWSKAL
ncbi:Crp/Fnr family transcriptional regulator [Roseovarius amoyensis]|uniref:Crp/Fnr family transcriptional regulator n=1 Tax=Roseovarius amoyensis TaxID=2211448 RepID=UPI000DBE2EC1|nr:Crp/Fnr family transcriptional regulator [Roseovarius amoyensis]